MYRYTFVGWSAFLVIAGGCGEVTASRDAGGSIDAGPSVDGSATGDPDAGPVDTDAPETTITSGPPSLSQSRDASFAFESSEPGSTFQCRIDTDAFAPCTSPHVVTVPADGTHSFEVYATDAAGNDDLSPAVHAFTVDTQAPGVTIVSGPANPTNETNASFDFTVDESATNTCALDGGTPAGCTPGTPVAYPGPLADGAHTFTVRAEDPAGNVTTETYNWTVDSSAPGVVINTTPASITNVTSAAFTFTADGGTTVTCSLDNATSFTACDSATAMNYAGPIADGGHTFYVKATDGVGNFSTASYSWTIDTVDPVVNFVSTPPNPTASGNGSFTFNVNETATMGCRLGTTGSYGACDSPTTYSVSGLTGDPPASYTVVVRATDAAGNRGTASYTWTVDQQGPTVNITEAPANPYPVDYGDFRFDAGESGVTYFCRIGIDPYVACNSGSYSQDGLDYGTRRFYVYARDSLGNSGPVNTHTWTATRGLVLHYGFDGDLRNRSALGSVHDGDGGGIDFTDGVVDGALVVQGDGAIAKLYGTWRPLSSPNDTAYTIGFWIQEFKPIFDTRPRYFLDFRSSEGGLTMYRVYGNDFQMRGGLTTGSGGANEANWSEAQYRVWTHIGITYPDAQGTGGFDIHVNGAFSRNVRGVGGDVFAKTMLPDILVGADNNILMDDLKIYNVPLKENERCQLLIGGTWTGDSCTLPPTQ